MHMLFSRQRLSLPLCIFHDKHTTPSPTKYQAATDCMSASEEQVNRSLSCSFHFVAWAVTCSTTVNMSANIPNRPPTSAQACTICTAPSTQRASPTAMSCPRRVIDDAMCALSTFCSTASAGQSRGDAKASCKKVGCSMVSSCRSMTLNRTFVSQTSWCWWLELQLA